MSKFFQRNLLASNYMVALVTCDESLDYPFVIRDQGGLIPSHEDINKLISGLQKTYSNLSEKEIYDHNQKIIDVENL